MGSFVKLIFINVEEKKNNTNSEYFKYFGCRKYLQLYASLIFLLIENVGFDQRIIGERTSKMMRFTCAFVLLTLIVRIEVTIKSAGLRK